MIMKAVLGFIFKPPSSFFTLTATDIELISSVIGGEKKEEKKGPGQIYFGQCASFGMSVQTPQEIIVSESGSVMR